MTLPGNQSSVAFLSQTHRNQQIIVEAVEVSPDRSLFVAGTFVGKVRFGEREFSASDPDLFVLKLDAKGRLLWAHTFQGKGPAQLNDIALDHAGHLLVTGWFRGDLAFANHTFANTTASPHPYLARLQPDGTLQWARHLNSAAAAEGVGLAIAPNNHIWLTGYFGGQLSLGSRTLSATTEGSQLFLARWNERGEVERAITAPGHAAGVALQMDTSGHLALAGTYRDVLLLGSDTLHSQGQTDIFLTRLDPDGRVLWSLSAGGAGDDRGVGLALGMDGTLYLHSLFGGTGRIRSYTHTATAASMHTLSRIHPSGKVEWSRIVEQSTLSPSTTQPYQRLAVAVSPLDQIYVLAERTQIVDTQSRHHLVLSLFSHEDGAAQRTIRSATASHGQGIVGRDLSLDTAGTAVVAGWLQGQSTLQNHTFQDAGSPSAFVWHVGLP